MLTQNQIWQVNVVPLGLMNGARGIVVGVVYKQEGQARSDGRAVPTGFPCLREACPLPDFVIVNFPFYSGNAFSSTGLGQGCLFLVVKSGTDCTSPLLDTAYLCDAVGRSPFTNVKASQLRKAAWLISILPKSETLC